MLFARRKKGENPDLVSPIPQRVAEGLELS